MQKCNFCLRKELCIIFITLRLNPDDSENISRLLCEYLSVPNFSPVAILEVIETCFGWVPWCWFLVATVPDLNPIFLELNLSELGLGFDSHFKTFSKLLQDNFKNTSRFLQNYFKNTYRVLQD